MKPMRTVWRTKLPLHTVMEGRIQKTFWYAFDALNSIKKILME